LVLCPIACNVSKAIWIQVEIEVLAMEEMSRARREERLFPHLSVIVLDPAGWLLPFSDKLDMLRGVGLGSQVEECHCDLMHRHGYHLDKSHIVLFGTHLSIRICLQ
jgi:hypothetical protein